MKNLIFAVLVLLCVMKTQGAIHTETIDYKQGDTTLEGFLAYDDSISGKRPGVLVVHQWFGLTDYEKKRAQQLAQLAAVAFCADIYGKDSRPKNVQDAGATAGKYKADRALLRARVNAALDVLEKNPLVGHVTCRGHWLLFRWHDGPGTRPQRRAGSRHRQFSWRLGFADARRRQEYQMQSPRARRARMIRFRNLKI